MRKSPLTRLAIASIALFCFSLANAQSSWYSVGPFVIAELGTDFSPYEGLLVYPPAGVTIPNPGGCAAADAGGLSSTNPAYKTLSANLMAAFMSGKQVRLWFPSPNTCAVNRPALIGVDVFN